ncbi:hypothetical protein AB4Y44_42805, partial [Paraburkholderia sp. BR10937]|uniref:hypothetical protein n=1 Tax=Paraburkholderia sp. BR10937 TaxID=3236994 RepID=UPI0034D314CF
VAREIELIRVRNVHARHALDDARVEVRRRAFVRELAEPLAAGEIRIDGIALSEQRKTSARRALYSRMQVVFQDPFGSLSPR